MAVYTRVSDTELAAFLASYDIGQAIGLHGITEGVENSNYRLETAQGVFILTLYEKRVDAADLPFFLGLMDHMASRGISCPLPVRMRDGSLLGILNDRPAAIVSFLAGNWQASPSPARCHSVGCCLGQLHLAGLTEAGHLQRANALGPAAWQPLLERCGSDAEHSNPQRFGNGLMAEANTRLQAILASWPEGLPEGIIHADLFPDNVLFSDETITGVIDFYFACRDLLAYDLAVTLNAWCFDTKGRFMVEKAAALVAGYQSARPLSEAELAALPVLCRGAAMRFFLTRLYDWLNTPADAQVRPHDPLEYWYRLETQDRLNDATAYGAYHREVVTNAD